MIKSELYNNRYVKFISNHVITWFDIQINRYIDFNTIKNISLIRTDLIVECAGSCEIPQDNCCEFSLVSNNLICLVSNNFVCLVGNHQI
jgi:hypothetical protein